MERKDLRCVLVPHTHWDREWYRTFESFRGRLVDAVDRVLDLLGDDPGFRFVLDGQAIVIEDYLDVRPQRRADLARAVQEGRVAIGPWYVQPDSLIPHGETHVRNLLEGRRVANEMGGVSNVAYTPDSFGHPAQFPQLFAGFGLRAFVYWRGNGAEIDRLGSTYDWVAPDGSVLPAYQLAKGYFGASSLPVLVDDAVTRLQALGDELATRDGEAVLFMNGVDHALPDANTAAVCDALARATGWIVERGLLDDFIAGVFDNNGSERAQFSGELIGARRTIVLPGVWSSRLNLKLRNRACETALIGWAEPWAALGAIYGTPDEHAALRLAWRALLENQAHDSICGCSIDAVHAQMEGRFDTAQGLAEATATRAIERIAGLGPERRTPWTEQFEVTVFNPSPHPRTDVVHIAIDGFPPIAQAGDGGELHPALLAGIMRRGFTVDGAHVRVRRASDPGRFQVVTQSPHVELEVVVADVPAFGWRRVRVAPCDERVRDLVDDGCTIAAGAISVDAASDGTLTVQIGGRAWAGCCAVEDCGDRGDSYDADPVGSIVTAPASVTVERRRHPSGIEHLRVERTFVLPAALADDRERRGERGAVCTLTTDVRVAPGVDRVDLRVTIDNHADDHRLRLLFPTGTRTEAFRAATTFDVAMCSTARPDDSQWVHPAPSTFPHQGWVAADGLVVGAPGLPEAEVTTDGTIAITLLRAVGWLSRGDLRTRAEQAGPGMRAPGAQCRGPLVADLVVAADGDPAVARDAELGLHAVAAGDAPLVASGVALVELEPRALVLSALKPASVGEGLIARVLNPTDEPVDARLRLGFEPAAVSAVRLDETQCADPVEHSGRVITFAVPPHALRTLRVE